MLKRIANQLNIFRKTKLELQEAQYVIKCQTENNATLQSQMLSLHRIQHDVSNQLMTISYLLESGKYKEAKQLLDAFRKTSDHPLFNHYTGNTMIDAVINVKLAESDNNIIFENEGTLPAELPIGSSALCSVISNLLDNAFKECKELNLTEDTAVISLRTYIWQNFLIIQCSNPCAPDAQIPDDSLPNPQKSHGWGIHILRHIAGQYNGSALFKISENQFTAEIQLNLFNEDSAYEA